MTKDEALKLALETLECWQRNEDCNEPMSKILEAIKEALAQPMQEPNKDGSPCPEFWDWLPKAYNFDGNGAFTKYNMEVAFLAGKQASQPAQPEPVSLRRGDRLICLETEDYCVIYISGTDRQWVKFPDSHIGVYTNKQVSELFELLPKNHDENQFNPDWDTQAVLVEEQQRMAKRILELEALLGRQTALLERQTARIVDLQTHIANLEGEE